jgi:hypothetical protein
LQAGSFFELMFNNRLDIYVSYMYLIELFFYLLIVETEDVVSLELPRDLLGTFPCISQLLAKILVLFYFL